MLEHNLSSSAAAQIGLAHLREESCFRFDFQGISLGCDSTDAPCVFRMTGLQWNGVEDIVQGTTTFEIAACPERTSCKLKHESLDAAAAPSFANLTAVNITLAVRGEPRIWWADDIRIAWTNDDCAAGACRARVPNTITPPNLPGSFAGRAKRLLRWAVRG
jgi:hypothetical protein